MIVRNNSANWLEHPFSSLTWGSPFGSLDQLRRELDHLFSRESSALPDAFFDCAAQQSAFSLDENNNAYRLTAQVPGLTEKDLEVTVTPSAVSVKGSRKVEPPEGYTKVRQERTSYSFDRSFQLPKQVDSKRVEAKLENGTLTVIMPLAEEAQPRRISVLNS